MLLRHPFRRAAVPDGLDLRAIRVMEPLVGSGCVMDLHTKFGVILVPMCPFRGHLADTFDSGRLPFEMW